VCVCVCVYLRREHGDAALNARLREDVRELFFICLLNVCFQKSPFFVVVILKNGKGPTNVLPPPSAHFEKRNVFSLSLSLSRCNLLLPTTPPHSSPNLPSKGIPQDTAPVFRSVVCVVAYRPVVYVCVCVCVSTLLSSPSNSPWRNPSHRSRGGRRDVEGGVEGSYREATGGKTGRPRSYRHTHTHTHGRTLPLFFQQKRSRKKKGVAFWCGVNYGAITGGGLVCVDVIITEQDQQMIDM